MGDEEAIHERNIYSILLIEGRSNKHIKQALLTYPREKVVSHLRQQGFITLNVRLEIDSGFGSRAVIAANKNLTFIESLFGWQDYFYSVGIYNNNKKYLYSVRTYYNAAGAGPRDYRHNDEIIIRRNPLKIEYNANGKAKIIKQGE
ncbi:MAG: hypothetical protein GY742_14495 [Hyphomicrobiales bacterium]|nr:hypothetical protein [Hyphomicrobiales bacterium]